MPAKTTLKNNQQGLVSIVVTMIIMIVLTLVVTGFAQLARREQREALDRQLSTQALYAAESGINDAASKIAAAKAAGTTIPGNSTCNPANELDGAGGNVQYTCVLVNPGPASLKYGNVATNQSTLVPIKANGLSSITIGWQSKDNPSAGIYSLGKFPTAAGWSNNTGILRIDLVRVDATGLTSGGLQASTLTSFLYPTSTTGNDIGYNPSNVDNKGSITNANCNSPRLKQCSVDITGLSSNIQYYLRIKSIYTPSDVEICANACDGNTRLTGAQYEIDSTGRANDVLKRVQVRFSPEDNADAVFPEYVLDSTDDVCKLLSVWPNGGSDAGCTP